MPPHCDSMDGPVVTAAGKALEAGNVDMILPFVHKAGEPEVRRAFEKAVFARRAGGAAAEVADLYFFETAVRVHRAGEGAPYTGLKPTGLDEGPVIPLAEDAVVTGSPDELIALLADTMRHEIRHRLDGVTRLSRQAGGTVDQAREYVEAMLGFEVYSHHLYEAITAASHDGHAG